MGADQAQHRQDQAGAGDAGRRHDHAGHLHLDVRVRVRRRDLAARPRQLPRVPDRRDARDGPGPDRAGRGRRAGHRHVHRADGPVQVAADVALGGAGGAVHRRTAHPAHRRGRRGLRRAGHRLAGAHRRGRRGRGARARAAVRLRVHLGGSLPGHGPAQPGGGAGDRVHHLPAADVRVQRVRADPGPAGLAAAGGGVEPDVRAGRRVPAAVRQPEPGRLGALLADAAPRARGGLLVRGDSAALRAAGGPPVPAQGPRLPRPRAAAARPPGAALDQWQRHGLYIGSMVEQSGEFAGLAALVTGGASGIGLATARLLASRGARVAVLDRVKGDDESTDLYPVIADVTDDAAVRAAVAEAGRALGRLDIVVNNAGIGAAGTVEDNDDAEWHRVFDVNVLGIVRTTRAALPLLRQAARERGQAAIVNTCSSAAIAGLPQRALYSATKGAVYSLTLAMAADHVAEGIRVNCVTPGTADTPWVGRLLDAAPDPAAERAALAARQPMARLVSADEVAAAIAYLAIPLAGATTGTALAVDGGMQGLRIRPRPT